MIGARDHGSEVPRCCAVRGGMAALAAVAGSRARGGAMSEDEAARENISCALCFEITCLLASPADIAKSWVHAGDAVTVHA